MLREKFSAYGKKNTLDELIESRITQLSYEVGGDDSLKRKLQERWYNDPELYAKERLGLKLTPQQVETALAMASHEHTAVKSGQKTGKSKGVVLYASWWSETRKLAPVLLTSTTDDQVKLILWMEIRTTFEDRKRPHREGEEEPFWKQGTPEWVLKAMEKYPLPEPPKDPRLGMRMPLEGNIIVGRVASSAEATQGFSGFNFLIIVDEASGVPDGIFAAIEGNTAGGGRQLLLGNPTQTSGMFYDVFHRGIYDATTKCRGLWRVITISSWDTPNAKTGKIIIPGLATRKWCQKRLEDWGEDDPRYQVRVLGRHPTNDPLSVITLGMIEKAKLRRQREEATGLRIGVDVARYGSDSSTVYGCRSNVAARLGKVKGQNTHEIAGLVKRLVSEVRGQNEIVTINVDATGIGSGVVDTLDAWNNAHAMGDFVSVNEIHVSEGSSEPEKFLRKRDEIWWYGREWLSTVGCVNDDDDLSDLEGDLLAPRFKYDDRGRIVIESKKDMKTRTGKSPDDGDGFLLAIWDESGSGIVGVTDVNPAIMPRWGMSRERGY